MVAVILRHAIYEPHTAGRTKDRFFTAMESSVFDSSPDIPLEIPTVNMTAIWEKYTFYPKLEDFGTDFQFSNIGLPLT